MAPENDEKIETVDQLAEWLLRVRPESVCVLAQNGSDKAHFMIVNGSKQFANTLVYGIEFLIQTIEKLDPPSEPTPINRAERRRRGR